MTAFEWVKSSSTLTLGTFFEHIKNPSGEGGVGETIYVGVDRLDADLHVESFDADLDIISLSGNLHVESFDADLHVDIYTADLTMEVYDGNTNNSC